MEEKIIIIIREIIQPIFISVLVTIITVKLSLKKFRSEKWWEKKAEAYSKIVDILHQLKNYCDQKLPASYGELNLSPEKENELAEQYKIAYRELVKALDVGSFIISEEAVKILETYKNRPQLDFADNPLCEIIECDLKYIKECLQDFRIAAKKDLGIK